MLTSERAPSASGARHAYRDQARPASRLQTRSPRGRLGWDRWGHGPERERAGADKWILRKCQITATGLGAENVAAWFAVYCHGKGKYVRIKHSLMAWATAFMVAAGTSVAAVPAAVASVYTGP